MEKTFINVEGMSCSHCVNAIKNSVGKIDGVKDVEVDLGNKSVTVEFDPSNVTVETIKDTIEDEGYDVV